MQGKLSEIDIRSILQLIELGQRTGELFVEAYGMPAPGLGYRAAAERLRPRSHWRSPITQSWLVFFLNGQIIYAGDSGDNVLRLKDYLRRFRKESALDAVNPSAIATVNAPEYGHLWALIETHVLTPNQGRHIIQSMVQETLFDLFSLHQGAFVFELGAALSPQLSTLEISPLISLTTKRVQDWKQFHPHIQSPNQCPVIADATQLRESLPESMVKMLGRWVDGKTSLRQISRYANRDLATVAKAIYPYVKNGLLQMVMPSSEEQLPTERMLLLEPDRVPRVVCIDDGVAIRQAIEHILNQHGYEASSIGNPIKALSLVFQLKPDLILCDIAMPELDGYEICAMLRKSTAFRQTPIIMLTGKDGFIDRVKARVVGATDYLTKPFGEQELITLVERYVGAGNPNHPKPEKLLADALEDS